MPTVTATIGDQEVEAYAPPGFTIVEFHNEAVTDSGDAYHFEGSGNRLTVHCEWCSFTAPVKTKTEGRAEVQKHYDDLGANVEVHR